jgi:hypothetical protein
MSGLNDLLHGDLSSTVGGPAHIALVLLVAFCIGHVIGWVYMWTHTSLSYSKMYVSSLVALTVLTALVMTLMATSIFIAFGLLAVFAVVRFRNVLKDTRDTVFILWAIVEGLGVGTSKFGISVVGCVCLAAVFLYLRITSFGGRHRYDVVLSLHADGDQQVLGQLRQVLTRHSARATLASQHSPGPEGVDLSYHLLLRDPARSGELLSELEATPGIAEVSLYKREDESEL